MAYSFMRILVNINTNTCKFQFYSLFQGLCIFFNGKIDNAEQFYCLSVKHKRVKKLFFLLRYCMENLIFIVMF